ncbi:tyrosinase family oxidase copper chaperone [Streptomyces africanus]|uniref:tyrosinase family oxidase copper chaperone n=1 Tax=Streptomyces africanus TaxID=231024 RepID=UPI000A38F383|nr:tyrosinase family oxidase copper chaperone [Streptomyces africanus]
MVVSIGGGPEGEEAPGSAQPAPAGSTRRDVTRRLPVCALAAVLAAPVAAVIRPRRPGSGNVPDATVFAETYHGRRIRAVCTPRRGPGEQDRWHVTVDDRPLHLMRRADGTWLSMVDHYCSYRSPIEAARAAVDELGPGEGLRVLDPGPAGAGHMHAGDRHGVHA